MSGFSFSMLKVSKIESFVWFLAVPTKYFRFGKVKFMVGIFKEIIINVRIFTFFRAGIVFAESCKQISGSLCFLSCVNKFVNALNKPGNKIQYVSTCGTPQFLLKKKKNDTLVPYALFVKVQVRYVGTMFECAY